MGVLCLYYLFCVLFLVSDLIFMWYFYFLVDIFVGGGYAGVHRCWNLSMATVWVMGLSFCFSFFLLVLNAISTHHCIGFWLLYNNCFMICVGVSDLGVWMSFNGTGWWGRRHISRSPVATLSLLIFMFRDATCSVWGRRYGVNLLWNYNI